MDVQREEEGDDHQQQQHDVLNPLLIHQRCNAQLEEQCLISSKACFFLVVVATAVITIAVVVVVAVVATRSLDRLRSRIPAPNGGDRDLSGESNTGTGFCPGRFSSGSFPWELCWLSALASMDCICEIAFRVLERAAVARKISLRLTCTARREGDKPIWTH